MKIYLLFKRISDLLFALLLSVIASPIMLICAILIKVEDPNGPVLFKQERVGEKNKVFRVYKFRSMVSEREKDGYRLSDSERILKVGAILRKLSLDELPQMLNIIKGEMSFIGPRPLPSIYLPYYTEEELHRHDLKPGISGWAQVNGRNHLSWEERFKFDLEYVYKVNALFDIKIVILTIKKVLLRSDIGVRGVDIPDLSLHEIRKK